MKVKGGGYNRVRRERTTAGSRFMGRVEDSASLAVVRWPPCEPRAAVTLGINLPFKPARFARRAECLLDGVAAMVARLDAERLAMEESARVRALHEASAGMVVGLDGGYVSGYPLIATGAGSVKIHVAQPDNDHGGPELPAILNIVIDHEINGPVWMEREARGAIIAAALIWWDLLLARPSLAQYFALAGERYAASWPLAFMSIDLYKLFHSAVCGALRIPKEDTPAHPSTVAIVQTLREGSTWAAVRAQMRES